MGKRMMIKVSVIIPVYNVEKYLEECLNSIERQTLQEIEVICIDDGSEDKSLDILKRYKKRMKLVIIEQRNAGAGAARNVGIKNAKGKYVIFVDPDDYLASDYSLEKLYQNAIEQKVNVCGGNLVKNREGVLHSDFTERRKKSSCFEKKEKIYFSDFQYPFAHQRFLINKRFLLDNNIFYPTYRRGQDVTFLAKVLICAKYFYAIDEAVYICRDGHKEVAFSKEKIEDYVNAMYDVLCMAIENDLRELFIIIAFEIENFTKKNWYKKLLYLHEWDLVKKVNGCLAEGIDKFSCKAEVKCLMNKEELEENYRLVLEKEKKIEEKIKEADDIVIYGAGIWGKKVCNYLKSCGKEPRYFVVSKSEANSKIIEGIKVIGIEELDDRNYLFILGSIEKSTQIEMRENLLKKSYENIMNFDFDILNYLER